SSADDTVLRVASTPHASLAVSGSLLASASHGAYAATAGTITTFSYNGTCGPDAPTGQIGMTIKHAGHVITVRTTSLNSIARDPVTGQITMTGSATVRDTTNSLFPTTIDSNAAVELTFTLHAGGPPTVSLTVWKRSGGLYYSSNWNGTRSVEQA